MAEKSGNAIERDCCQLSALSRALFKLCGEAATITL